MLDLVRSQKANSITNTSVDLHLHYSADGACFYFTNKSEKGVVLDLEFDREKTFNLMRDGFERKVIDYIEVRVGPYGDAVVLLRPINEGQNCRLSYTIKEKTS